MPCRQRGCSWGDGQDLDYEINAGDHGFDLRVWVELRGFEPLTPSMRTRCATGLRYSPKTASQRSKLRGLPAHGSRRTGSAGGSGAGKPACVSAADRAGPSSVADGADRGGRGLVLELGEDRGGAAW